MRYVVAALLMMLVSAAQAIPVEWTLQDVQFEDGGTAYGTFTYDADIEQYSNVDITTTLGTLFGGASYDECHSFLCPTLHDSLLVVGVTTDSSLWFGFIVDSSYTNAGGTKQMVIGPCQTSCESTDSGARNVVSGSVSAVPVPAAVWLFASAIAGLGWFRRKQIV